jgi:predicted GH43/DUF377 family glycosyl hydrolase
MNAWDEGIVLRHGHAPRQSDIHGARDLWLFKSGKTYFMHYDGAGPTGWLACLATSQDLRHWKTYGPVLQLGKKGSDDSASASYGTTYFDGKTWQMFYLGTPHVTPYPDLIPTFPYETLKAYSYSPWGKWIKQPNVVPFRPKPNTYYSSTATPGVIFKRRNGYMMFFSAADDHPIHRTMSIARTKSLNGSWTVDPKPILPPQEQIENNSFYYEPTNKTWFMFVNHVGVEGPGPEYTDAVWVYWTKDLDHWSPAHKAIVLDHTNCKWSRKCIGLPSVMKVGGKLAIMYDSPGGDSKSHMERDIGLCWLKLPLTAPK